MVDKNKRAAVFLDRDGVIVENRTDYVRRWEDLVILPGVLNALQKLSHSDYSIIIVTNQSAVGRGIISLQGAWTINERLVAMIQAAGGRINGVFMCPHMPEDLCDCRKPAPGLLLQAAEALGIDLERSVMIGDALSDVLAGEAAGVGQTALVRTGRGADEARRPEAAQLSSLVVYETLGDALGGFIWRNGTGSSVDGAVQANTS